MHVVPAQSAYRNIGNVGIGEAQLGQPALVIRIVGNAQQPGDSGFHDLIERSVRRQLVKTAGETLRRSGETRKLPHHLKSPAKRGQFILAGHIATRHALTQGVGKLAGKQPDQDFEQGVALRPKRSHCAAVDLQIERDGQHIA